MNKGDWFELITDDKQRKELQEFVSEKKYCPYRSLERKFGAESVCVFGGACYTGMPEPLTKDKDCANCKFRKINIEKQVYERFLRLMWYRLSAVSTNTIATGARQVLMDITGIKKTDDESIKIREEAKAVFNELRKIVNKHLGMDD